MVVSTKKNPPGVTRGKANRKGRFQMEPGSYTTNPSMSTLSGLSPFPEAVLVLIGAWLIALVLTKGWERSRRRSRLPLVFMAMTLMCSCTARQRCFRPFGVWHTRPNAEPASVTIWPSGKGFLRLDGEILELRK